MRRLKPRPAQLADLAFKAFVITFYAFIFAAILWHCLRPSVRKAKTKKAKKETWVTETEQLLQGAGHESLSDVINLSETESKKLGTAIAEFQKALRRIEDAGLKLCTIRNPNVEVSINEPPIFGSREIFQNLECQANDYRDDWAQVNEVEKTHRNVENLSSNLSSGEPVCISTLEKFCGRALQAAEFLEGYHDFVKHAKKSVPPNSSAANVLTPILKQDLETTSEADVILAKRFRSDIRYDTSYLVGASFAELREKDKVRVSSYFESWPLDDSELVFKRAIPSQSQIEEDGLPNRLRHKLRPLQGWLSFKRRQLALKKERP